MPKQLRISHSMTDLRCATMVGLCVVVLASCCHKNSEPAIKREAGLATSDPQVLADLVQLTKQLRQATQQNHQISTFEQFVAAAPDVVVPPPPPGDKYAIGPGRKVVLVYDKTK